LAVQFIDGISAPQGTRLQFLNPVQSLQPRLVPPRNPFSAPVRRQAGLDPVH
jgi:hypothetical protein